MRNPLRYGNKAALIVGVVLMLVDYLPLAHEFGAWNIGSLLCVWYSASAINEDVRIGRKVKYMLYAYLAVVLVIVIYLHESEEPLLTATKAVVHPTLQAIGLGAK